MAEAEPLAPQAGIAGPRGRDDPSRAAIPDEAPPEFPGCRPIRLTETASRTSRAGWSTGRPTPKLPGSLPSPPLPPTRGRPGAWVGWPS